MIIEALTEQALQILLGERQYALSEKLTAAIESRYSVDRVWNNAENPYLRAGEQSQRRFQPTDTQKGLPSSQEKTLGELALVAKLFCRKLRRHTNFHIASVH